MVLSTPAIKALKRAYPAAELTVLASPSNGDILKHNPHVDRIMTYDNHLRFYAKLRLVRLLKKLRFDLAVDPYPDYELLTALLSFFSGAAVRTGYASFGREAFFNVEALTPTENSHFIDITLGAIEPIGIKTAEKKPEIFLSASERNWAQEWVRSSGLKGKPLVGIHPGAYYESQRWPIENVSELIELMSNDKEVNLLLLGSRSDEPLCRRIVQKAANKPRICLTDTLREFSAILACCQVLVCNNSGPMHMAVALNVPTVSTMGPSIKSKWMPVGDIHKVFRIDQLRCIGCNLAYCKIKTHDCMRLITPKMIEGAVCKILSKISSSNKLHA